MTNIIHRLPSIFYGLAVIFFVWSLANGFWELHLTYKYADNSDPMVAFSKSKVLYQALLEATYLVANGAMIQVFLKILEKVKSA
jgi:hypothetical protein